MLYSQPMIAAMYIRSRQSMKEVLLLKYLISIRALFVLMFQAASLEVVTG